MNVPSSLPGSLSFRSNSLGLLFLLLCTGSVLVAAPLQTFTDSDDDPYTVKLSGPGAAAVTIDDPDSDTKGPIASIALTGTDATSVLTITVMKVGDGRVRVGQITGAGALQTINATKCDLVGTGIQLGRLASLRIGDVATGAGLLLPPAQRVRALAFTARDVGAMQLTAPSHTLTFTARTITGGAQISAAQIAAFKVTGGNCEADIVASGKLIALSVKGGDFSGHIAATKIGSISVKKKVGVGGSILASTIAAKSIGSVNLDRDLIASFILAGADLGDDLALGGTGGSADTFGAGSLRTLIVKRHVIGSIVGAGFSPVNGAFGDINDGVIGNGITSFINVVTIRGTLDAASFIGARKFPKKVSVAGQKFRPAGNAQFVSRMAVPPTDPGDLAPELDPTVAMPAASATAFLYTGPNAVQTDVDPGTIEPARAAVLRGRVLKRDNTPLAGVMITVLDHPELGRTHSRADGMFDLAVNGGGPLVVKLDAPAFCPVQRQVDVTRQDFEMLGDVVLIGVDPLMTSVTLGAGSPMQMHEATVQDDDSDPRHAALMFQPDTSAMFKMADGTMQPVTAPLSIRATEFTVGPNGPNAMPGVLPPNSAYTYCAELTADETPAGASLEFTKPVFLYVENFLNFEIGIDVPSGFYDQRKGLWQAGPSGRVIAIVSETGDAADLDVNGDGTVDTGVPLTALGITDAERTQLATSYAAGQSLWRVPIPHFSPWDCNWAFGPPPGAGPPNPPPPTNDNPPNDPDDPPSVFIQSQSVGSRVILAGVPFGLTYRSERLPGRTAASRLKVPLDGGALPGPVKRIQMEVSVAGRSSLQEFPAATGQTASFEWDGLDAYERAAPGRQQASVRVGYVYDGDYTRTNRFGLSGTGAAITGDRTREEITISTTRAVSIGAVDVRRPSIGGWTLDVHHTYDPVTRKLHVGDGTARQAESITATIKTAAGTGLAFTAGFNNDGIPATQARLIRPAFCVTGEDGTLYFSDAGLAQIFRVDPDGTLRVVAGIAQSPGYNGDERPAIGAQVSFAFGLALAPDGTLFFVDAGNRRVRSITPDGMIHTVAGTGVTGYSGDGGPATAATMHGGVNLMRSIDGSLFISDTNNRVIRRVGTDGIISTVAGTGVDGFSGDGGPATAAQMVEPLGTALDADGNLYIADGSNRRIRRVGPDGIIRTIAGTGAAPPTPADPAGDGGPAIAAQIGFPNGISLDREGNLYIADGIARRIRKVSRTGIMTSVAGTGAFPVAGSASNGDGGAALQAATLPTDVTVGSDGSIFFTEETTRSIRQLTPPLPGFDGSDIVVPSETGAELYRFDAGGRHLSTVNSFTGAALLTFAYDGDGQLVKVTDGDGNATTIQRTAGGAPTAIVGPFGHRTLLTADANGTLTRIEDPDGGAHVFAYDAGGLLISETDPVGQTHAFAYDTGGLLTQADHAGPASTGLSRVQISNGYFVTTTNALGHTEKYQIETPPNGGELRTNSDPAGVLTTDLRRASGITTFTSRDGLSATRTLGPDPRFGLQSAFDSKIVTTTPGGITRTIENAETVALSNPADPLTLTATTRTTNLNGRVFTRTYTAATRTFLELTPAGREVTRVTDPQGRLVNVSSPGLAPIAVTYNAGGRIAMLTGGAGAEERTSRFTHEMGYTATFTNELGQETKYARNAHGQITELTRPDNSKALYAYDATNRLVSVTPPGSAAHTFTHTPWGQLASYTAPGGVVTTLSYDADQRWTQIAHPGGEIVGYGYDAVGRVTSRTTDGATTTFAYHPTTGNLATATAPGGNAVAITFDGTHYTGTTWSGTVAGSATRTIDNFLRTASRSVNGAHTVNFTYDDDGQLSAAGALTITRDPTRGWITGVAVGVVTDTRTANDFGELTSYTASAGGNPLLTEQKSYDKLGRVTRSVQAVEGGAAQTFDYAYDTLGRLRDVRDQNGAVIESFTWDANGNRAGTNIASNALDQLTQFGTATFAYTASGRRLARSDAAGTTNYTHDARGQLIGVAAPAASAIEYLIDPFDRRIGKMVGGALVQGFFYDSSHRVLAELDGANAVVSTFVYADLPYVPAYMVRGGQAFRLIADGRGSVRLVVNAATGAVAQRLDYSAFGEVLSDTNPGFQPFGFAGGLYDPDTRLTRFGPREYDAAAGVWLQSDPLLFSGRQLNLYAYAAGDPVNYIDITGLYMAQVGLNCSGVGHTSISVNGDGFIGFFPGEGVGLSGVLWGGDNGQFLNRLDLNKPDTVYQFELTEDQFKALQKYIKDKMSGPRPYNLFFANCTTFIVRALEEAGQLEPGTIQLEPDVRIPRWGPDAPKRLLQELKTLAQQGKATQVAAPPH